MTKDWQKHPNGDLKVGPLMGWQVAIVPMTALLRLEAAMSEQALKSGQRETL